MSTPLLSTKIYIPPARSPYIARERLIDALNRGQDRKLTLISAPAGYGKTSLLSAWIIQQDASFAWLTLDENDNDLGRFLAYLIASLQSIDIQIDSQVLTLLQSTQTRQTEAILNPIINQLAAEVRHFTLVLDDYHVIHSADIHEVLTYILDHLPEKMHLVISSRADPPIPLARLRAQREMTEIRASDLRFSIDENISFFRQLYGLELTSTDSRALIDRTEGWVAALQMVGIAVKEKADLTKYIRGITGKQDYIAEFLSAEVFSTQPEPVSNFLLKTCILDRFSGPLCDAVTGNENSQAILKNLVDSNLFLISLDAESHWFRYHHLFADLLNQRLLETYSAEEITRLYRQASDWFQANHLPSEAIEYAIQGNLMDVAASIIEEQAQPTLMRSEISTFLRWVRKLPDELVYSNEILSIYTAWALLVAGKDTQQAARYLERFTPTDEMTGGRLNAVRSIMAVFGGQIAEAISFANQALARLPEDDLFFRQIATWNLSAALFLQGETAKGADVLEEVARIGIANKNFLVAIVTLCRLGTYYTQTGDLYKAEQIFDQALWIASEGREHPLPVACEALLGLGKIYWEWNQLETARQHLTRSIDLSKKWRENMAIESHVILAHVDQSFGDEHSAEVNIQHALRLAKYNTSTESDDKFVASQEAYLQLRQGNRDAASNWALGRGFEKLLRDNNVASAPARGPEIVLRYELLVYARLLLVLNRTSEALELIDQLIRSIEPLGHQQKIIEAFILKAIGLAALRKTAEAVEAFKIALSLAEKGSYIRIFVDDRVHLVKLVSLISKGGSKSIFIEKLLESFDKYFEKPASREPGQSLIEPLSKREIDVLRLLDSNMTSNEIAELLSIAVSTTRVHIKHIYGKLGVNRRFEAIARARDLNIL